MLNKVQIFKVWFKNSNAIHIQSVFESRINNILMLLFLLQCSMNKDIIKHAINKSKMRPGQKFEHHHMKAMLYKLL